MILSSAYEFESHANPEIKQKPSDNVEVPWLLKELPEFQEKVREMPYAANYSVKARALMYAHLTRFELPALTLEKDKNIVVKKCPFLINEMINITTMIMGYVQNKYLPRRNFFVHF
jgi:translocation protein SEC63